MMKLNDKKIIAFALEEANELRKELENAFVALDKDTSGPYYSGDNIRESHPKLWQLFKTL